MKRRSVLILACLLVICIPLLSTSVTPEAPRQFAPVQKGFVTAGEQVLPYAPDRIMVKFTEDALEEPALQVEPRKGTMLAGARTGISSVDALNREVGALKIYRPYIELKNKEEEMRLGINRWFMVELPRGSNIPDVVGRYKANPNVEIAQPDYRAFPAVVPSDPLYPDHWGHNNTVQLPDLDWGGTYDHTLPNTVGTYGFDANAQGAWDASQGFGSSSVIIAILDSGVDIDHPDLNLVSGYDFGDGDSNPDDNSAAAGHGTCCAGVAASLANNGIGACGAAPGCRIMPCKVADSGGSMYFSYIENALYWAADNGADVISMSLGAYVDPGYDPATDAAISYAYNAGCVILAATSNDNYSYISYPANHAYVIGVGAASPCGDRKRSSSNSSECNPGVSTDPNGYTCDGERWWGSNYGPNSQDAAGAVDILGPTILPTTDIQGSGGYRSGDYEPFFNGTSCATPYVAGVCGLIKSQNPTWTPAQIRNQLVTNAIDIVNVESGSGWDRYSGYGMVDAEAAVGGGGPTPPTAAFVGSPTSGFAPLTVDFTDQSTGGPTSWSWDFGDTGSSGAQNPSHTYNNPGTYTVTLTVSNAYGSDDEVKTNYIEVLDPGDAFADLPYSTGFESGSLDQYWTTNVTNEGRVQITTANTPHTGSYHMTMDDAVDGGNYSQCEAWLHLDLAGKSDVELDFWWKDFSDETHTQDGVYFSDDGGSSFTKVYDLPGASYSNNVWYNFVLDVDNLASSAGLSLTSTFVIKFQQYDNYAITTDGVAFDDISVTELTPTPPVAAFVGNPTSGEVPLTVNFTDQSTGTIDTWSWDFGDGVGTSSAQNPSYEYTSTGTYTVTLTVTGPGGSDDEVKVDYITVNPPAPPVAAFVGNPTSGDAPLTVNFTDQSTGSIDTWSWDFGDGVGTSSAQNPSYEYTAVGTYTVTLTVTGPGGSDDEIKADYITVTEPGEGYANLPYTTGFESGALDEYWQTYLGTEGRIRILSTNTPHSGTYHLVMDDHTNGGSYSQNEAWLLLNLAGKTDVDLDFWWKEFGDETHTQDGVYFSDNGGSSFVKVLDLPGASYTNNTWQEFNLDLDDLAASAGLSLTGTFVVKFQQYDNYGITTDGFAFDDISVTSPAPQPPVAAFVGNPTSGVAPLTVDFTDQSTGGPTSWSWDFGDGVGTSTAQNPTYEYTAVGTYTVTLTATNAYGSDDEVKVDYINVTAGGGWEVITYDDFEAGWGSYTDGGGDCSRYTGGTYAHQGNAALDIQDNSGTASSFYHTVGYNVSGYVDLEVEFWYIAVSMDNSNEDFWLQYYDGSTWQTVETWARSIDFDNGVFYHEVVQIPSGTYNYPTNARLRFMCDASGNADDVYIDEIEFRGLTAGGSSSEPEAVDTEPEMPTMFALHQNYPNPFNPVTTIRFSLVREGHTRIEVFNVAGQRVATLVDRVMPAGEHEVPWNAAGHASGVYFCRLTQGRKSVMNKMVLLR